MDEEQVKKTILIVEDDLPVLKALTDELTREDFRVLQAKDGEEGLITAVRDHPDLILLDIIMPKMDGLTVMRTLREESAWGKSVPIILLTNLSPDDEKINKDIAEYEPAYYLIKTNLSMSEVIAKVKERVAR